MNVLEMVGKYLEENGFDGLFNRDGECACEMGDLAPCDQVGADCEAGCIHTRDCDCKHCQGNNPTYLMKPHPVERELP